MSVRSPAEPGNEIEFRHGAFAFAPEFRYTMERREVNQAR